MGMKYRYAFPIKYTKDPFTGRDNWPMSSPTLEQLDECKQWCKDNVGTNGWNYYGMYRDIPCEFRFKRGEDLVAFKLRFAV